MGSRVMSGRWSLRVAIVGLLVVITPLGSGGDGSGASGTSSEQTKLYVGVVTTVPPVCQSPVGLGSVCFTVPSEWEKSGGGAEVVFRDASGGPVGGLVEVHGGIIFTDTFCGEWGGSVWPASELHVVLHPSGCKLGGAGTVGTVTATFFAPPDGSKPPE